MAPGVGTSGKGASTTNAITPNVLTTTVNGAWVLGGGLDWQALGNGTSTDTFEAATPTDFSVLAIRKAAATATAGTVVTFNMDAGGTGTPAWSWAALEVVPAAGGALAINAATPILASVVNRPVATAAFTAPADSLLAIVCFADDFGAANPTLTLTSTGLSFTSRIKRTGGDGGGVSNGVVEIITAPVPAGQDVSRTVSLTTTNTTNDSLAIKVFVVTEAAGGTVTLQEIVRNRARQRRASTW